MYTKATVWMPSREQPVSVTGDDLSLDKGDGFVLTLIDGDKAIAFFPTNTISGISLKK